MSYSYNFIDKDIFNANGVDEQVYLSLKGLMTYLNDKEPFINKEINIAMGKFFNHIDNVGCVVIDLDNISEQSLGMLNSEGVEKLKIFLLMLPEYIKVSISQSWNDSESALVKELYEKLSEFIDSNDENLNRVNVFLSKKNTEVVIYGSCDSRDIIRIYEDTNRVKRFDIKYYIAGNSMSVLFDEPISFDVEDVHLDSKFLETCVQSDLRKDAFSNIIKNLNENSIIIMDFMDERFDIISKDGCKYTKSWNIQKTKYYDTLKDAEVLTFDSDEKFSITTSNFDKFIMLISKILPLENVFINETTMSSYYFDGVDNFLTFDGGKYHINRYNAFSRKLVDYIKINHANLNILETPAYMNFGDGTHLWGAHPYHYNRMFYLARARRIFEIMAKRIG